MKSVSLICLILLFGILIAGCKPAPTTTPPEEESPPQTVSPPPQEQADWDAEAAAILQQQQEEADRRAAQMEQYDIEDAPDALCDPPVVSWVIAAEGTILRTGAGEDFDIKLTVDCGAQIEILGFTYGQGFLGKWALVRYGEICGWTQTANISIQNLP